MLSLLRPRPSEPTTITVAHMDAVHMVQVKRSARAKRLTLRIRSTSRDAVVSAPLKMRFALVEDFVRRHAGWLDVRLKKLGQGIAFHHGQSLPLRGEPHLIVSRPDLRGAVRVAEGAIVVPGDNAFLPRKIEHFLKQQAKIAVTEASRRYAEQLGVSVKSVSVRDTHSRWGSCSTSGALNYSWRLILAPPFVLDYLCAHEVAHRREMNHSIRFWRIVHELCPHTDAAKAWLKAHGAKLHHYGQDT